MVFTGKCIVGRIMHGGMIHRQVLVNISILILILILIQILILIFILILLILIKLALFIVLILVLHICTYCAGNSARGRRNSGDQRDKCCEPGIINELSKFV